MSKYTYTDEIEARMREASAKGVTPEVIASLATEFNFPERSVAAKFRALKIEVPTKVEAPETFKLEDKITGR